MLKSGLILWWRATPITKDGSWLCRSIGRMWILSSMSSGTFCQGLRISRARRKRDSSGFDDCAVLVNFFHAVQQMENHTAVDGEDPGFGLHKYPLSNLDRKRMLPKLTQLSSVMTTEAAVLPSNKWCCGQIHSLSRMFYILHLILSIDNNVHLHT